MKTTAVFGRNKFDVIGDRCIASVFGGANSKPNALAYSPNDSPQRPNTSVKNQEKPRVSGSLKSVVLQLRQLQPHRDSQRDRDREQKRIVRQMMVEI
jgi:hypothetical protein